MATKKIKKQNYGRTSKLTGSTATQEIILRALGEGLPIQSAAAIAGVSRSTLWQWMRKGDEGNEEYATFALECKRKLAEVELRHLRIIEQAAKRNWTASAWTLERRWPHSYSRRTITDNPHVSSAAQ